MAKKKVTRETTLGEVAALHPNAAGILFEHGMHCVGCPASSIESIGQGARTHGLTEKEIDEMIKKINEKVSKKKKE